MLAAFDKVVITPPLDGTWPDAFIDLKTGVLDDIHARLLLIDAQGQGGALLVSLDVLNVGLPEMQRLESALCHVTGLPSEAVWIMVSHSHSAPIVGAIDDYTEGSYEDSLLIRILLHISHPRSENHIRNHISLSIYRCVL